MGSSYSDLNLYFKRKKDDNKEPKEKGSKNGKPEKFSVTVKKENYEGCVNFEKVTHTITFNPYNIGVNYNIILNDSCDKDKGKGKNIFGYYYPSNDKEVLKELHVYYSVLAPDDPLVVSFYTHGVLTHNFTYSGLLSTRWVRAYSIAYYSLSETLTTKLLTKEFQKLHRNRKIKFVTEKKVVEVTGFKQELEKGNVYRYIYYPNGDKAVLGSECLCKFDSETPIELKCPKPSETANTKPAETQASSSPGSAPTPQTTTKKYDNKIDSYYLDLVNGHHYDGVILYFVINGNKGNSAAGGSNSNNGQAGSNGQDNEAHKDNYDRNMAVLLELIDNCKPKTHIKRNDKLGNHWSKENFKYDNDKELIEKLKKFRESAEAKESTTFILEKKGNYKGVQFKLCDTKTTYKKYSHTATTPNKPNLLFRKKDITIGKYTPDKDKTKSLDIYFLKIGDNEQGYPFIIMITNVDEKAAASQVQQQQQQQQPSQQQQPQSPAGAASGSANGGKDAAAGQQKECKKCYFSSENYDFTKWLELEADKKEDSTATEKPEKTPKQPENNQAKELEEKLKERLDKIEQFGKCTKDINILRSIAYQVLTGVDDPDTKKPAPPAPPEERPKVMPYTGDIGGTSLKVVLGSVAGGLVVLGTMSAIIYGIYWYNTTIKLLT